MKNKNFFDLYNEILVVVNLIKKYSKYSSDKFDMFVGMRYLYLRFEIYKNNVILDIVEKIKSFKNNLEEKRKNESNEKLKDKYDRQLLALQLMINEFLKLQLEVKKNS